MARDGDGIGQKWSKFKALGRGDNWEITGLLFLFSTGAIYVSWPYQNDESKWDTCSCKTKKATHGPGFWYRGLDSNWWPVKIFILIPSTAWGHLGNSGLLAAIFQHLQNPRDAAQNSWLRYLLTVNTLCHMHLEHNGAMLPSVFRSVLYLDVFGWSSQVRLGGPSDVFLCDFTNLYEFQVH